MKSGIIIVVFNPPTAMYCSEVILIGHNIQELKYCYLLS